MDPLSAIGLAGNIIQFVDFGCKLLASGVELYQSGSLGLNLQVENATQDLQNFTTKLQAPRQSNSQGVSENDLALKVLCHECSELAAQLLEQLNKLKVKITPPPAPLKNATKSEQERWRVRYREHKKEVEKLGKTLRVGLLSVWNRSQIEETVARLEKYRAAIQSRLLGSLIDRVDALSIQQSQKFDRLDLETKQIFNALLLDIRANLSADIRNQTEALAQLISRRDIVIVNQEGKGRFVFDIDQDVSHAPPEVIETAREDESLVRYLTNNEIIASLDFDTQSERYEGLCEAHEKTFRWIFDTSEAADVRWDSFVEWLETGSGLYWIQGKAGSGKSTLMKYICRHPLTKQHLTTWANGYPLYTAEFYFWALGRHTLQKSQIGLLRALLHQILKSAPDLIPTAFPEQWSAVYSARSLSHGLHHLGPSLKWTDPWNLTTLSNGWNRLINSCSSPDCQLRIAIFVDGLDEFKGLDSDIAKLFEAAASSPNVKFCVSSRPERAYEKAFEHRPSLRLQDLTYNDIRNYVEDRLLSDFNMKSLFRQEPGPAGALVEEVVESANGVFLWVYLVVTSLLMGLNNDDGIADLQRELRRLPKTLKNLYIHMITLDGEVRYKEEAVVFFQLVNATQSLEGDLHQVEPMNILGMCLALEPDEKIAATAARFIADPNSMTSVFQDVSRRLKTRTGGLLEIQLRGTKVKQILPSCPVGYLHRTVQEFLITPEMRVILQEDNDFRSDHAMLKSCVYQLQIMKPEDQNPVWFSALNYARRDQFKGTDPEVVFLDQLYTKTPRRQYKGHGLDLHSRLIGDNNGVPIYRASNTFEYFLYMAIEFDLPIYIREKFTTNQQFPSGNVKRSLLHHALGLEYKVSPQTILALLSCGRDPFDLSVEWQPGSARTMSNSVLKEERTAVLKAALRYLDKIYPSNRSTTEYKGELEIWAHILKSLLPAKAALVSNKSMCQEYEQLVGRLYGPFPELQSRLLVQSADLTSKRSSRQSCRTQ